MLLIAGKGHEDYQIIGTTKHHFSDHEVVAEALGRMSALWTVAEVLAATGGRAVNLDDGDLTAVSIDSREIEPGALFVAIKGDVHDGHDFVAKALEQGAAAALVSEDKAAGLPQERLIVVPDALQGLARSRRRRPRAQQGEDRRGHRQRRQDDDQGNDPHRARGCGPDALRRSRASTITGACR